MSLVLWYKLNGSSLGEDSSDSALDIGNVGATSFADSEIGSNVAYFNGSSYLTLNSSQVPSAMLGASSRTISFWAKTGSATTGVVHGNGFNHDHQRFRGRMTSGTTYGIDMHTETANGSIANPLNTWGHFACTFDSGATALKTYINGVLDVSAVKDRMSTGTGSFCIGRDPTNTGVTHFNGYVSDFRVYDDALDAAAISSLTNAGPLGVDTAPDAAPDTAPDTSVGATKLVSTDYVYSENGVDINGLDAASGADVSWLGWDGPQTWTITFPVAIENVVDIDFTVMQGVTMLNTTPQFDGAVRLRAYDEADNLVGSRESVTINRSSSNSIADLGVLSFDTPTVIKKVQLMGPSNSGPNINFEGLVDGVTTYRIVTEVPVSALAVQMYKRAADLTWDPVPDASSYTLTQTLGGGVAESVIANQIYDVTFTAKRLVPGSNYEFKLYTDLDLFLDPVATVSGTTVDADVSLNDVFETGDSIKVDIPGFRGKSGARFVKRGGRVDYAPGVPIAFAFEPGEGTGQSATLGLEEGTDVTVAFDEINSEVSVDGVNCALGGYVVVDGKTMTVVDI